MRFIAMLQKDVLPKAEFVDAGATDEATVKLKARGSFALITLAAENSRLLRLTAASLPLKIENRTLRWRDYEAPLTESRILFVGRNPEGNGVQLPSGGHPATIRSSIGLLPLPIVQP